MEKTVTHSVTKPKLSSRSMQRQMGSSPYSEKGMHCARILGISPLVLCQSVGFIQSHNLMKHLTNEKHITCSYNAQVRAKFLKLLGQNFPTGCRQILLINVYLKVFTCKYTAVDHPEPGVRQIPTPCTYTLKINVRVKFIKLKLT